MNTRKRHQRYSKYENKLTTMVFPTTKLPLFECKNGQTDVVSPKQNLSESHTKIKYGKHPKQI